MPQNLTAPTRNKHYDIIVAGGGTAGVVAAIQIAREGKRCLLLEKTGLLGGTAITGGVNFPGLFHAWGKQIIAGIGWEILEKAVNESGGQMPDFRHDERRHSKRQVWVDRFSYSAIIDREVQAAGVNILLHTHPIRAKFQTDSWELELACKEGTENVTASMLIDTTGDANLVRIAGFPTHRNPQLQPGTLIFKASGYSPETLDYESITEAAKRAIQKGQLFASDLGGIPERVCSLLRNFGDNIIHICDIDASTSAGKTEADLQGRAALFRLQQFFRKLPGLENFTVDYVAPECGIRETVTIEGDVKIRAEDYTSGRLWEDAICYSFYPIDLHRDDGNGIDIRPLKEGTFPTLPLRALLPKGSQNLIVAGRIACGDKESNSAYRVQASSMAMGQAAGAAAVLACESASDIRNVPVDHIRELLAKHGAIVPSPI